MGGSLTSSPLRWYQIAGLILAGLSSFALAAFWNMPTDDAANELVEPVIRSLADTTRTATAVRVSQDSLPATAESPLQMSARSESGNGQVAHNPFGNLNLLAGVELASSKNPGSAARIPTSNQARKPKVEPPPIVVIAEAPPPPPPPTAPALPFSVVGGISGQQIAEGRPVVFLRLRDEVLVVRPGDEIDKTYRVETITPQKIEFIYLPLQQRQTLSLAP
jgi:hypothetical protein